MALDKQWNEIAQQIVRLEADLRSIEDKMINELTSTEVHDLRRDIIREQNIHKILEGRLGLFMKKTGYRYAQ